MQNSLQHAAVSISYTGLSGDADPCCSPVFTPVDNGRPPHCTPDKILQEGILIVAELDAGPVVTRVTPQHNCLNALQLMIWYSQLAQLGIVIGALHALVVAKSRPHASLVTSSIW